MRVSWDTDKDKANQRKHGIGLDVAASVFLDPHRIEVFDDREDYGEHRWVTVGAVESRVLVVVYTVRHDSGEVIRLISARKVMHRKEPHTVTVKVDSSKPRALGRRQRAQLVALGGMTDRDIDCSDIPRLSAALLERAVRGGLYRPVKRQISVRIDADVLAWLKTHGKGYHTRLNEILRSAMAEELKS